MTLTVTRCLKFIKPEANLSLIENSSVDVGSHCRDFTDYLLFEVC